MRIEKKVWPEFFEKVKKGEKNFELRLADFDVKPGDILVLREWDPNTKKYTGREIEKRCGGITKLDPSKFYSIEENKKFGLYIIELVE